MHSSRFAPEPGNRLPRSDSSMKIQEKTSRYRPPIQSARRAEPQKCPKFNFFSLPLSKIKKRKATHARSSLHSQYIPRYICNRGAYGWGASASRRDERARVRAGLGSFSARRSHASSSAGCSVSRGPAGRPAALRKNTRKAACGSLAVGRPPRSELPRACQHQQQQPQTRREAGRRREREDERRGSDGRPGKTC